MMMMMIIIYDKETEGRRGVTYILHHLLHGASVRFSSLLILTTKPKQQELQIISIVSSKAHWEFFLVQFNVI